MCFNPQTFGNAEKRFFHDEVKMMIFYLVRAMRVDNEFLFSTKTEFFKNFRWESGSKSNEGDIKNIVRDMNLGLHDWVYSFYKGVLYYTVKST